jgi:hypothetical protein
MAIYNLSKIFPSVSISSFYFDNLHNILDLPEKQKNIAVTKTNVTSDELAVFSKFAISLGLSVDQIDNFGIAKFDKLQLTNYSPAFFALNEDEEMGLIIGADKFDFQLNSTFVKAEYNGTGYKIGGKPLELLEQLDNDSKPTGKVYMSVKVSSRDSYTFPVVIKSEFKGNPDKIFEYWESGNFQDAVAVGGKGGNIQFGQINKLFRSAFTNNLFPATGVYFLLEKGSYTFSEKSPNYTSGIEVSNWKVVSVSHPELLVDIEVEKQIVGGFFLNEISYVSFPKSGQPTKLFSRIEESTINEKGATKKVYNERVLLWVTELNTYTKNPEHIPSHVLIADPTKFNHTTYQFFPEFAKVVDSVNTLAVSVPSTEKVFLEGVSDEDLEKAFDSMPQEYPKAAIPTSVKKSKRQPSKEELAQLDSF